MDVDFSLLGWAHALAATIAILAGAWVFVRPKGTAGHKAAGRVFVVSLAATCVSALGIYQVGRWFFPHTLAVITLGLLAIAYGAARLKRPRAVWVHIHLSAMIAAAYMLGGGAVNEAFLHVNVLRNLGPAPMATPALGITHMVVMLAFVAWLIAANVAAAVRIRRGWMSSGAAGAAQ